MVLDARIQTHTFLPGEEVLVRLAGIDVLDAQAGHPVPALMLPRWTIGRIIERNAGNPATYVLSFRNGDQSCLCTVPADAIDGVV